MVQHLSVYECCLHSEKINLSLAMHENHQFALFLISVTINLLPVLVYVRVKSYSNAYAQLRLTIKCLSHA